jgi:hypothetical protein
MLFSQFEKIPPGSVLDSDESSDSGDIVNFCAAYNIVDSDGISPTFTNDGKSIVSSIYRLKYFVNPEFKVPAAKSSFVERSNKRVSSFVTPQLSRESELYTFFTNSSKDNMSYRSSSTVLSLGIPVKNTLHVLFSVLYNSALSRYLLLVSFTS